MPISISQSHHESRGVFLTRRLVLWAVFIFGILATGVVFMVTMRTGDASLEQRAATIAAMLNQNDLQMLTGTLQDDAKPAYLKLKAHFESVRMVNPDIRFVYLLGKRNEEVFFYLDSEDSASPDVSLPGDVYFEATPLLKDVFDEAQLAIEGPETDRWGTWMSAFAPVIDERTGAVLAVVGIDVSAKWYYAFILAQAAIPALLTVLALVIVWGGERLRRKHEEIRVLRSMHSV